VRVCLCVYFKMVLAWWTIVSWSKAAQSSCTMVRARPNTAAVPAPSQVRVVLWLCCCVQYTTADTDERFRLIFDAYDADGGGTISATELMRIAHEKGNEMGESLELVKNVMSTIDADGTGQVEFDEFLSACKDTPLLLDAFEQLLPSPSLLKRHVADLNKIPPGGTCVK
jgi:hypothetical protein